MQLLIGDATLSIAQMGPNFLFIDAPIDLPPCEATIVLQIEGSPERRWQVRLPEGLSAASERVAIAKV
jgi:hypothetical protein